MSDYRNDKFQVGDIVRLKSDHQIVGRINKAIRMSDVSTHGYYDDVYYWTEYYFDNDYMFKSYDEGKYELLMKEIGYQQIKEYDKILINTKHTKKGYYCWQCDLAAGWINNSFYKNALMTISNSISIDDTNLMFSIMPYNDYTKQFIGTNKNRPDFYYHSDQLEIIMIDIKEHPNKYKIIDDTLNLKIKYYNL